MLSIVRHKLTGSYPILFHLPPKTLIYYPAVLPAQRISDIRQKNGETVILMALLVALAPAIRLAFTPLVIHGAFTELVVSMAFTPMVVHMAFAVLAYMAFMPLAVQLAFGALAVHGQGISLERFIPAVATLLLIKG